MVRPGHVQVVGRLRWLHGVPRAASAILATEDTSITAAATITAAS